MLTNRFTVAHRSFEYGNPCGIAMAKAYMWNRSSRCVRTFKKALSYCRSTSRGNVQLREGRPLLRPRPARQPLVLLGVPSSALKHLLAMLQQQPPQKPPHHCNIRSALLPLREVAPTLPRAMAGPSVTHLSDHDRKIRHRPLSIRALGMFGSLASIPRLRVSGRVPFAHGLHASGGNRCESESLVREWFRYAFVAAEASVLECRASF